MLSFVEIIRGSRGNVVIVSHDSTEDPAVVVRNEFGLAATAEATVLGRAEGQCFPVSPPEAFEIKRMFREM